MEQEIQIPIENKSNRKQVPKLRFREFLGEWQKDVLKNRIESIDSGWSPQCEDYSALVDEWGVLKTTSVVWEGFNANANKKLPDSLIPRPNLQVSENDILITRAGPTNRVGVIVHVNRVRRKLMVSDKLIRLRSNDITSSLFLSISLGNRNAQKQLISKSSGLAESQTNISQKILLNTKLVFASLPEQKKIATFLSAVDKKTQQLSRKKELLETYKKGVMQQLFSLQLRFKDENGKDFPEWKEKRLGELFKFKQGFQFAVEEQSDQPFENSVEFIRIINVTSSPDDLRFVQNPGDNFHLNEDDLFMVRYGDAGRIVTGFKGIIANNMFRLLPIVELSKKWHYYYLDFIYEKIHALAGSSTMPAIKFGTISGLLFMCPSYNEQQKIADFLSAIDIKIEAVSQQITKTQSFKKGLLQQMFV